MHTSADRIRNVALVGHRGSGKTSLHEALLYTAGAVTRLGRVTEGTTVSDADADEKARQMSISATLTSFEWSERKVNLLDTPGEPSFVADALGALRVCESAVFVVNAVMGVEVSTTRLWQRAAELDLARLLFVNMLDRERADFFRTLDGLKAAFGPHVVATEIPIGSEQDVTGVIDLVDMKAYAYDGDGRDNCREIPIPDALIEQAQEHREKLMDEVAENSDALMERYLEGEEISHAEIVDALKEGTNHGALFPVTCGVATRNLATNRLLDAIVEDLPSPVKHGGLEVADMTLEPTEDGDLYAYVFKTRADAFAGRINLFRVYQGVMRHDSHVLNTRAHAKERIGQLLAFRGRDTQHVDEFGPGDIGAVAKLKETRAGDWLADRDEPIEMPRIKERLGQLLTLQGKEHAATSEFVAGDIGAVAKLKETRAGDWLAARDEPIAMPAIDLPAPVMAFAIEPKTKGDEDKVFTALRRLQEEDPTIDLHRDAQTGEQIVAGLSQVHVEVVIARLRERFGAEVELHPPRVPYQETIRASARAHGRHKKQSGGRGQFGDCQIEVEPLEAGEGFEFVNAIRGGSIPGSFIPAVEKGVVEAMQRGAVAGYPVKDVRVRLYDGSYHSVDSSEMAFKTAGALAMRQALEAASPVLLEPIMHVTISVPEDAVGDVIGDLNSRRGRPLGMEPVGGMTEVRAEVPMAEMLGYAPDLRSITGGQGEFTMDLARYEEVPAHLVEKAVAHAHGAAEAVRG
jgi:elongation factor G